MTETTAEGTKNEMPQFSDILMHETSQSEYNPQVFSIRDGQ